MKPRRIQSLEIMQAMRPLTQSGLIPPKKAADAIAMFQLGDSFLLNEIIEEAEPSKLTLYKPLMKALEQ